jgi:hypothetical protein
MAQTPIRSLISKQSEIKHKYGITDEGKNKQILDGSVTTGSF